MSKQNKPFQFEISLSVLNHLGRNLYRNFITVLGEAISNSWDADAENVWIYIDKENNNFVIKDDGIGMTADDFQDKFLTVGYSKRKDGNMLSQRGRPYIGAKGIGKLALLSCAGRVNIISKTTDTDYIGGVIDNLGLDEAIKQEMKTDEYSLEQIDLRLFNPHTEGHNRGTIIYFEQTKENIRNSVPYLKKLIALYFRFSLIDESFNIYVNNERVTFNDIKELSEATEFLWNINALEDPYIATLSALKNEPINIKEDLNIRGFIAAIEKPRYLKIVGTEEKAGIDLFVNGRLRERNIIKHMPDFSTRYVASYLYGQIHFDDLDKDKIDRFNSSRDGILSDDEKYNQLIKILKENIFERVSDGWDALRLSRGEDGDDENPRKTPKERRASSLFSLSTEDYSGKNDDIDNWTKELRTDAEFNIPAYSDCFLSENLVRKYIKKNSIELTKEANIEIAKYKNAETNNKDKGNISIDIRKLDDDVSFLSMDGLAYLVDKKDPIKFACLARDANEYKPIRDALAHTSLLTEPAKQKLTTVYDNIKGRLKTLLSDNDPDK